MSIRNKLLLAFDRRSQQVLSGAVLAERLRVSRTSVWKHVKSLRDAGIPLESAGRHGYRLDGPADFSLTRFAFSRPAASWITPHYFLSTASTQTLAKAGATAGLPEGHLWLAEVQRGGRGRLDRAWESRYGGLWFSLLLRPKIPPGRLPALTLVAGLCLREAIQEACGVDSKLKWPNDLLIPLPSPLPRGEDLGEGSLKKAAGILTEMSGQMDQTDWVVLGIGLNVNNTLSVALRGEALSLRDVTGGAHSRGKILESFLARFRKSYGRYQKEGFEPFRAAYWRAYSRPNQPVRLRTARGVLAGILRGVDASGAIMVESRRKIRTLSEGEIVSPSQR